MKRILVVDDNSSFLETISLFLSKSGHSVKATSSVPSALQELQAKTFEVVLSDLRIGTRSGVEIMEYVRLRGGLCIVVAITAHANATEIEKACRLADAILIKPFPLESVLEAISRPLA